MASVLQAKRFPEIPRAVRAELCAPGGTLILDGMGIILGLEFPGADRRPEKPFPPVAGGATGSWDKRYTELVNSGGGPGVRLTICWPAFIGGAAVV